MNAKPTNAEILEHYRRMHEAGRAAGARGALLFCASKRLAMPDWLAVIISEAIDTSRPGKPDDILGIGNEKMLARLRKEFVQGRNTAIRRHIPYSVAWHKERGTGVTKTQIIRAVAKTHRTSVKNIEKILYSPTLKPKK